MVLLRAPNYRQLFSSPYNEFLFRLTTPFQNLRRSSVKGAKDDEIPRETPISAPIWAVSASCERPKTASPCRSSSLLPGPAIFRGVVGGEQACLEQATISASRAAPVVESGGAVCFPTGGFARQPDRGPGPGDCER